ncbi:hypothetical protein EDI_256790 [Entamoeba dispar SAW760]|uniref:Uncharacterized protein n=1 Tax=Entamoeba dispar (strain ATCC PRA-260 / SAW760) TaxID=370354 RepID=B0EHM9_ENTDS|nr:uncharacterized protein EDI_256790 [Entamoeba dispar SAW760]EDR25963.1 hypothetical protein EDI_256790 [Entamoeba dispar SAW760]|eukprot:EDR25963.1 hypothetical protein EDI_256790 [Entamoeba dispar SAW760]
MKPTPPPKPKSPSKPTPPPHRANTQPLNTNINYIHRQSTNPFAAHTIKQQKTGEPTLSPRSPKPVPQSPVNRYPQKQTPTVPSLPQKLPKLSLQFKKIPTNPFDEPTTPTHTTTNPFDEPSSKQVPSTNPFDEPSTQQQSLSPKKSINPFENSYSPKRYQNKTTTITPSQTQSCQDITVELLGDDEFEPKEYEFGDEEDKYNTPSEEEFEIDILNPSVSNSSGESLHSYSNIKQSDSSYSRQSNITNNINTPQIEIDTQKIIPNKIVKRQTSSLLAQPNELPKRTNSSSPTKEINKQNNSLSPRVISLNSKTPRVSQKIDLKGEQLLVVDHNQYIQNLIVRFSEQCYEHSPLVESTIELLSTSMDDKSHYEFLMQTLNNKTSFDNEQVNIQFIKLLTNIVRISDHRSVSIASNFSSSKFSLQVRNNTSILMKELSKYLLKDVVDSFLHIIQSIKNDETTREAAVMIICFKQIILPVDGINVSESVRFISNVENALNSAQRSVLKRSLCELLDGVCINGLGRGIGIIQLEERYGRIIDLLRKWKNSKVPINETCAHLGAQSDGLFGLFIQPILVSNYTLLASTKDQQKRLKALEMISDYISGSLDVLPKNHSLIPSLVDEFLAKTILPKKEYHRLKYASNSEIPMFSKVFSHPVLYLHQTTMYILSGKFVTTTDIRATVIQHLPQSITLPSEVQQGVTEFLSNTSSLIGTVMDPFNIWALEMYPESFIHDSTARDTTSHKIVSASRSPILEIKQEARKALLRDAKRNPRLFCGIFEEFLGNGIEEESNWSEGEYVCQLAEVFGQTNDVASKGLVNMLQRRILALIITLDEKSIEIASRLVDALKLKGYRIIENSNIIAQYLSLVSIENIDKFVTEQKELLFVKELYNRLSNSYSSKMQPELIRFIFASMKMGNVQIIHSIISQYNAGVDHICSMVHSLLKLSEPSVIDLFASSMIDSKKKKFNLELLNTLVSIEPIKYIRCQNLISLCRLTLKHWTQFKDLPTSNIILFEIVSKICTLEITLPSPSIEDSLVTFISKYIHQISLHKYITSIVNAITLKARISSPIDLFNLLEILYSSDPIASETYLVNLLKRYPNMLSISMQRSFLTRDVRMMYYHAVYTILSSGYPIRIEEILSYGIILTSKNSNDFAALMKGIQGFNISTYCGCAAGGSWNCAIMRELAKAYCSESPSILKGVLQYHNLLSNNEYRVLIHVCCEWMKVAVQYDLEGTINIMIDMTSTAQQLDYEICEMWQYVIRQCEDKIDIILEILLTKAESTEESIGLIGKIMCSLCGIESLCLPIFMNLYNNIMELPIQPKLPCDLIEITPSFPSKKENVYFILLSFIISLIPITTIQYIPHLCALSLLFYAPTTVHGELEACARRVISIVSPSLSYDKMFTPESIKGIKNQLDNFGVLEQFEQIILSCCTVFQTEVAVNALDIFILLQDHPPFSLDMLSMISARGLLFGEVQVLQKVVEASIQLNDPSIAEILISVPVIGIFEKAAQIVPVNSIKVNILAHAAGRKETQRLVYELTKNCTGIKGWIGELIKIGTGLQKNNFVLSVVHAFNDFEPNEIVEILMSIAEGGSYGVSTEALLQLCKFKYTFINKRLVEIISRGMNCEETAQECAKFLESYCIETNIPKGDFEQHNLFFDGINEDIIKSECVKAIEKICLNNSIAIDHQRLLSIVRNHSMDIKNFRTLFSL